MVSKPHVQAMAAILTAATLLLSACGGSAPSTAGAPTSGGPGTRPAARPSATPAPSTLEAPASTISAPTGVPTLAPPAETPAPSPTAEPAGSLPLPPDPLPIAFNAADGQALQGTYFPSAVRPAPLVALMHWAPGDQSDWLAIAGWLQNRGLPQEIPNPVGVSWLDSSWFPPVPEGQSLGVFSFTFRGCEGGCETFQRDLWLLDAQAAIQTAADLEGVDPGRIVAVGASIGADGAIDGCRHLNQQGGYRCRGAFSLSPGDYLTIPYVAAAAALGAERPPLPAWCLYAQGDARAAKVCASAEAGGHLRLIEYQGNAHGMLLIDPAREPNALLLLLGFMQTALAE